MAGQSSLQPNPTNVDSDNHIIPATSVGTEAKSTRLPQAPRASSVPANPSNFTVGYVYSTEMTSHFSPHGHPEDPDRITRIWQIIVGRRYTEKMKWLPIRPVRREEALLVHSEDHWNKVQAIQRESS